MKSRKQQLPAGAEAVLTGTVPPLQGTGRWDCPDPPGRPALIVDAGRGTGAHSSGKRLSAAPCCSLCSSVPLILCPLFCSGASSHLSSLSSLLPLPCSPLPFALSSGAAPSPGSPPPPCSPPSPGTGLWVMTGVMGAKGKGRCELRTQAPGLRTCLSSMFRWSCSGFWAAFMENQVHQGPSRICCFSSAFSSSHRFARVLYSG